MNEQTWFPDIIVLYSLTGAAFFFYVTMLPERKWPGLSAFLHFMLSKLTNMDVCEKCALQLNFLKTDCQKRSFISKFNSRINAR